MWKKVATEAACLDAHIQSARTVGALGVLSDVSTTGRRGARRRRNSARAPGPAETAAVEEQAREQTPEDDSGSNGEKADEDLPRVNDDAMKRLSALLDSSPEYWTETSLYRYLTRFRPLALPKLIDIEQVTIQRMGGLKFRVLFENSRGEPCRVIICGTLLFRHYTQQFMDAKRGFLANLS